MPFTIRPYRRLPICCPVTYHTGDFEGHGTVWNLSLTGCRFSGNLPLRTGEFFSMTVMLPSEQRVYVLTATVCWVHGEDYGAETITMDDESHNLLAAYIDQGLHSWLEAQR